MYARQQPVLQPEKFGVVGVYTAADLALEPQHGMAKVHDDFARPPLATDVVRALESLGKNVTGMPGIAQTLLDLLDRGWHYATLFFGETQIQSIPSGRAIVPFVSMAIFHPSA